MKEETGMPTNLESIPKTLGTLRKKLIEEGYSPEQAFQIVLDLIRRGDSPRSLLED